MGYGYMDGAGFMGGWGMVFGGFMMLFWIAAFVALVVFLVRWISGEPKKGSAANAKAILEQRYARGELDTPEYQERLKALHSAT
ncbi:MAG: SHOCT domain-containing protein [Alphaproteobacteria bacterium]|nr:SHOCT domain-containing protein [Alphaproteobacteria bacterium]